MTSPAVLLSMSTFFLSLITIGIITGKAYVRFGEHSYYATDKNRFVINIIFQTFFFLLTTGLGIARLLENLKKPDEKDCKENEF